MSGLHYSQIKSVERQRKSLEPRSRAGSFSRRLRRDHPSFTQEEFPNPSICDEGFLFRSQTQDASRALWRNLWISAWLLWHFKMLLSTGQSCPLPPSVTLKLKLRGLEVAQVLVVPKTSPEEIKEIFPNTNRHHRCFHL